MIIIVAYTFTPDRKEAGIDIYVITCMAYDRQHPQNIKKHSVNVACVYVFITKCCMTKTYVAKPIHNLDLIIQTMCYVIINNFRHVFSTECNNGKLMGRS